MRGIIEGRTIVRDGIPSAGMAWPISSSFTAPALPTIAASRARAGAGWEVVELATGHDATASAPQALADALLALTRSQALPAPLIRPAPAP